MRCARGDGQSTDGAGSALIDPEAFQIVREPIAPAAVMLHDNGSAEAMIDYRLRVARGYSIDPSREEAARNRIFTRDFVLPARVGYCAHERAKLLRVCVNIDVGVPRPAHPAGDIRDVLSHDVLAHGIRIAQDITLLEMPAERITAPVPRTPPADSR